jgi:putative FmdB family regulatory protein
MPTYEYECPKCKEVVVMVHKMDEKVTYWCGLCVNTKLVRILSPTAGWVSGSGNPCRGK